MKLNRYGKIKVLTVVGGNKQRDYISKEEYISSTVTTEFVLISYNIDTKEERGIVVIDIPDAFIQTRIKNERYLDIINIRRMLVYVILDITPGV